MASQRLWPTVQSLGRTFICNNRSEILNHSVRAYNHQHNSGSNLFKQSSSIDDKYNFKQNLFKFGRGSYVKVVSRQLSSGTYHFYREFNDGENEYAHEVLCSIPAYNATTLNSKHSSRIQERQVNNSQNTTIERNCFIASNDDLVDMFAKLSTQSNNLEDGNFSTLCTSLSKGAMNLSDDQILHLLSTLCLMTQTHSTYFTSLKNSLDEVCCHRIRKWDISKVFLVADHWYALGTSRTSIYFSKLLQIIGSKVSELTPSQLVQFMFYANINRGFEAIKMGSLLFTIRNSLKAISIEELGIIAMGLFKTQTIIKDQELNREIINKMLINIDKISNHSLGSILKFLNKSLFSNAEAQCYDILERLNPHLHRFNNLVLLQVALLGNNLLVFHEDVIDKVGGRFGSSMEELRLKDIERFTYTLMLYKYIPASCPDILVKIINELRKPERVVEINHFPRCFVSCTNYLSAMGIFPLDLISASLQPAMIQLLQESVPDNMGRELNELNWSLRIEGPDFYPGYQLNCDLSSNLTKKFLGRVPCSNMQNLTHQERFMLDVQMKLGTILGGEHFVVGTLVLPHVSNPDLVFCTNREGEPMDIPSEYLSLAPEVIKLPLGHQQGLIWNAVLLGGRNSFLRNTTELRGNYSMKIRQLNKIGYRVTVIPHTIYTKRSLKYKLACLEKCLNNGSSLNIEGRIEKALIAAYKVNTPKLQENTSSNG